MYRQFRTRNYNYPNIRNTRNIPFNNLTRNISSPIIGKAIGIPKASGILRNAATTSIGSASKLGLGGILGGISKTISTVNQAMPLINQVKPLFGNVKSAFNLVKNLRNSNTKQKENIQTNINNNQDTIIINQEETTKMSENLQENYQFTPNKPYFS